MNNQTANALVDKQIKDAGIAIDGVSIGSFADRSTWVVTPRTASLQAQAQPIIDAFDMAAVIQLDMPAPNRSLIAALVANLPEMVKAIQQTGALDAAWAMTIATAVESDDAAKKG